MDSGDHEHPSMTDSRLDRELIFSDVDHYMTQQQEEKQRDLDRKTLQAQHNDTIFSMGKEESERELQQSMDANADESPDGDGTAKKGTLATTPAPLDADANTNTPVVIEGGGEGAEVVEKGAAPSAEAQPSAATSAITVPDNDKDGDRSAEERTGTEGMTPGDTHAHGGGGKEGAAESAGAATRKVAVAAAEEGEEQMDMHLTLRNLDTGEEFTIGENDPDFSFDTFELDYGEFSSDEEGDEGVGGGGAVKDKDKPSKAQTSQQKSLSDAMAETGLDFGAEGEQAASRALADVAFKGSKQQQKKKKTWWRRLKE